MSLTPKLPPAIPRQTARESRSVFSLPALSSYANQGTVIALYTLGCFFGSLSCIWIGDKLGRKRTIMFGAFGNIIGAILQCTSFSLAQLIGLFRVDVSLCGGGCAVECKSAYYVYFNCHCMVIQLCPYPLYLFLLPSNCLLGRNRSNPGSIRNNRIPLFYRLRHNQLFPHPPKCVLFLPRNQRSEFGRSRCDFFRVRVDI